MKRKNRKHRQEGCRKPAPLCVFDRSHRGCGASIKEGQGGGAIFPKQVEQTVLVVCHSVCLPVGGSSSALPNGPQNPGIQASPRCREKNVGVRVWQPWSLCIPNRSEETDDKLA